MSSATSSDFPANLSQDVENYTECTIRNGFTDENICGEGASCIVYRMHWQGLRVAVKRLKAEYLLNATFVSSYRKEFQLGQQLKHDGLPIYRDIHVTPDDLYIVIDFIDGISLSDFLDTEEGREYFSSKANVKRFLSQLLNIVAYLHRSGVIHCDIKPANIMLRNSDRGVMLLDLDKAYSDSLDRTHGGTPAMSDPLSDGKTPTAVKDFAAIGNLIDYISEKVSDFPKYRFRQLLRECRNVKANDDSVVKSLEPKSRARAWIAPIVIFSLIVGGIYYYSNQTTSTEAVITEEVIPATVSDTVSVIKEIPPQSNESSTTVPKKQKTIVVDFDKRMAAFIDGTNSAMVSLGNGELSDNEIRDKISEIIESYTSKYQDILSIYKSENSAISGIDVEMAVAKASEQSRATKLFQQFTQTATDTLANRHASVE